MKKKIISILLVFVTIIIIFACNSGSNVNSGTGNASNTINGISKNLEKIYSQKEIGLKSVKNARQLGGYKTKDGKKVKNNLLVRCGNLGKLSDEDANILRDKFNIKQILDFRTKAEIGNSVDKDIDGATYQKIQIIPEVEGDDPVLLNMQNISDDFSSNMMISYYENMGTLDEMYEEIVTSDIAHIGFRKFFDVLLNNDGGTIFHCSSGKDRTGFAAAFLLYALGVDMNTIIDDYEASIVFFKKAMDDVEEPLKENDYVDEDISEIKKLIGVDRQAFMNALSIIDDDYEGMDNYLHNQIRLSDEEIKTLKDKYLE